MATEPILTIELHCGCGGRMFDEVREEANVSDGWDRLLKLAAIAGAWVSAHAPCHSSAARDAKGPVTP